MRVQDIHYTDVTLKNEFVQKFLSGDLAGAFKILEDNGQLNNKKFVADIINYVNTALYQLEENYYTNVDDYLLATNNAFNTLINNYINKNIYSDKTTYQRNNFVLYNNEVYLYINGNPTSGNNPTNTNYWVYIGLRGDKGNYGIGVTMKYTWNNQATYNPLDIVYYNGVYYVTKEQNINVEPSETSSQWTMFLKTKPAYIATNKEEAMSVPGMIWFEIFNPYNFEEFDSLAYTWSVLDGKNFLWTDIDRGGF